ARLSSDDRERDVPALPILSLAGGGEPCGMQQLLVRVVDDVGILPAVIGLDPLVVTGHRYDGTATGERAAEHPVRRDGLQAGVDRSGPIGLRPGRVQPPPRELETSLQLAIVIEELPHNRRLRAWGDRIDRLPLAGTVGTGGSVGVQEPGAVELKREASAHHGLLAWFGLRLST